MYTVIRSTKTRAFRVVWMLEELGLPYQHDPSGPRPEAARARNPSGKVPTLAEGWHIVAFGLWTGGAA